MDEFFIIGNKEYIDNINKKIEAGEEGEFGYGVSTIEVEKDTNYYHDYFGLKTHKCIIWKANIFYKSNDYGHHIKPQIVYRYRVFGSEKVDEIYEKFHKFIHSTDTGFYKGIEFSESNIYLPITLSDLTSKMTIIPKRAVYFG
jgi:hypothetical protein